MNWSANDFKFNIFVFIILYTCGLHVFLTLSLLLIENFGDDLNYISSLLLFIMNIVLIGCFGFVYFQIFVFVTICLKLIIRENLLCM